MSSGDILPIETEDDEISNLLAHFDSKLDDENCEINDQEAQEGEVAKVQGLTGPAAICKVETFFVMAVVATDAAK